MSIRLGEHGRSSTLLRNLFYRTENAAGLTEESGYAKIESSRAREARACARLRLIRRRIFISEERWTMNFPMAMRSSITPRNYPMAVSSCSRAGEALCNDRHGSRGRRLSAVLRRDKRSGLRHGRSELSSATRPMAQPVEGRENVAQFEFIPWILKSVRVRPSGARAP